MTHKPFRSTNPAFVIGTAPPGHRGDWFADTLSTYLWPDYTRNGFYISRLAHAPDSQGDVIEFRQALRVLAAHPWLQVSL